MTFYTNISRVFRFNKFFQSQGEKWQCRRYVAPIQFHRSIPRSVINNFESSKRAVQAVLILSYKPQHQMQIYGNNLLVNSTEYESILGLILIVARIFVIGSVLTGLAIVYFVTRFTHRHVFPKILRRGKIIRVKLMKHIHIGYISCDCRHRISRANFYKVRPMGVHEERFVSRRCLSYAVAIATKRFRAFLDLYEAIAQSYIRFELEGHICEIRTRNAYRVGVLWSGIKRETEMIRV